MYLLELGAQRTNLGKKSACLTLVKNKKKREREREKSQIKEERDCRISAQVSETEKRSNSEELTSFATTPLGKLPK